MRSALYTAPRFQARPSLSPSLLPRPSRNGSAQPSAGRLSAKRRGCRPRSAQISSSSPTVRGAALDALCARKRRALQPDAGRLFPLRRPASRTHCRRSARRMARVRESRSGAGPRQRRHRRHRRISGIGNSAAHARPARLADDGHHARRAELRADPLARRAVRSRLGIKTIAVGPGHPISRLSK